MNGYIDPLPSEERFLDLRPLLPSARNGCPGNVNTMHSIKYKKIVKEHL